MRTAPCVEVEIPLAARVAWIRRGYAHFETTHVAELRAKLSALRKLAGRAVVDEWLSQVDAEDWDAFVASILAHHYDPVYARARARDQLEAAGAEDRLVLPDGSDAA